MKEALKLALEALERVNTVDDDCDILAPSLADAVVNAIDDIKEALAQPEQTNTRPYYTIDELNAWADEKEKQAWRNAAIRVGEELSSVGPDGYYDMNAWQWLDWAMENVQKAQPEQEPVAWESILGAVARGWCYEENANKTMDSDLAVAIAKEVQSLYTTPPQRKPLTDEQIADIVVEMNGNEPTAPFWRDLARAIEAAHGIKE